MTNQYNLSQKKSELEWKLNRITDIIERDSIKISEIETLENQLKIYNDEMSETMSKRNLIHDLIEDQQSLSEIEDQIYEYTKSVQTLTVSSNELLKKYNDLKDLQLKVYAGLLAETLEEGKPCPVCGSTIHIKKADLLDVKENEERMNHALKAYNKEKDQLDEATIILSQLKSQQFSLQNKIAIFVRQLDIEEDLSKELLTNMLYKIDKQTSQKLKTYKENENELKYLKKLAKSVKDSISLKESYIKEIEEITQQLKDTNQ